MERERHHEEEEEDAAPFPTAAEQKQKREKGKGRLLDDPIALTQSQEEQGLRASMPLPMPWHFQAEREEQQEEQQEEATLRFAELSLTEHSPSSFPSYSAAAAADCTSSPVSPARADHLSPAPSSIPGLAPVPSSSPHTSSDIFLPTTPSSPAAAAAAAPIPNSTRASQPLGTASFGTYARPAHLHLDGAAGGQRTLLPRAAHDALHAALRRARGVEAERLGLDAAAAAAAPPRADEHGRRKAAAEGAWETQGGSGAHEEKNRGKAAARRDPIEETPYFGRIGTGELVGGWEDGGGRGGLASGTDGPSSSASASSWLVRAQNRHDQQQQEQRHGGASRRRASDSSSASGTSGSGAQSPSSSSSSSTSPTRPHHDGTALALGHKAAYGTPSFLPHTHAPRSDALNARVRLLAQLPARAEALYACASCGTHLALHDELISKAFSGRQGKAYLFRSALNTRRGKEEERQLLTGLHTVADLRCALCRRSVGWTYVKAYELSQKYKEGKFILELSAVRKRNGWL